MLVVFVPFKGTRGSAKIGVSISSQTKHPLFSVQEIPLSPQTGTLNVKDNRWLAKTVCCTLHADFVLHFQLTQDSLGSTRSRAARYP